MKKITLVSRILQIVFWIALVCLPILTVLFWLYFENFTALGLSDRVGGINLNSLPLQFPLPTRSPAARNGAGVAGV